MKKKTERLLLFSSVAIKAMGFFYKLPLANSLGSDNLGLYQLVFPIYSLFLTLTSSAFSSAIAGRFNDYNGDVACFERTLKISGGIGSIALFVLAFPIAYFLGSPAVAPCFMAVSPAIYLVARGVYYKGVSQGKKNFSPTALSEMMEQVAKIAISLPFIIFMEDKYGALVIAVLAISLSEFFSLMYLKKVVKTPENGTKRRHDKGIALHSVSFAIFPLCSFLESAICVNFLASVSEYGLYSGVALVVTSIPITLISALSVCLLPKASEKEGRKRTLTTAIAVSLAIAIPFSLGIRLFSDDIIAILFSRLEENAPLAAELTQKCALIPLFQSIQLITTAWLYGKREEKGAIIALITGGMAKIALLFVGIATGFGINAAPIAATLSFLLAAAVNLVYIIREKEIELSPKRLLPLITYALVITTAVCGIKLYVFGLASLVFSVAVSGVALLAFYYGVKHSLFPK